MLSAKVRFALLFSTVAFRLVEIGKYLERTFYHLLIEASDCRSEHGRVLLVSPVYWLSANRPGTFESLTLEAKPLLALLTAMVLAGLREPVIRPATCDLESLGQVFLGSTARDDICSSETDMSIPGSGASREQVGR